MAILRDYIVILFNKIDTIQHHKLSGINLDPKHDGCLLIIEICLAIGSPQIFHLSRIIRIVSKNKKMLYEKIILDSIWKLERKFSMMMTFQSSYITETKTDHNAYSSFKKMEM
ncbi:hypothetical protein IEQ34_009375 [Dendrobium chrysotoxum]|uniref:Uncharacterized protein n=1 Tax=Dendrobium chrysotoxum TaxID=161865 RepID=A0AAV7H0I4_DENCH|nr:hypothetical protein IEQ34_009375 [Dendrobium chrysotoxum]